MQLNFQKRQKIKLNPTFTVDPRHENINQMSLNNALSILHNKVNVLEKLLNNNNSELLEDNNCNIEDNNNNEVKQYEEIIFGLQKKVHTMEDNIVNLQKQVDILTKSVKDTKNSIIEEIQNYIHDSKITEKSDLTQKIISSIPDDNTLKVMVNPIVLSNTIIKSDKTNDNYTKLYDISYENFINKSLLDDVN